MFRKIAVVLTVILLTLGRYIAYAEKYEPEKFVLEQELEAVAAKTQIRAGAGEDFPVTSTVSAGDKMDVIGIIGNWYVVCLDDGTVGVVSKGDVRVTKIGDAYINEDEGSGDESGSVAMDIQESLMFSLVNSARSENGLEPYGWDDKLNKIARLKAEDMAKSGNISHVSETYGTPFQMLKSLYAPYKNASENISTSASVYSAHASIMARPQNRANVFARYDKMGVGVVRSENYGEIIVQLFVRE